MKTIGDRLRERRNELGLSQAEVARRAKVSAGTIGNLETGDRQQPRKLVDIARALDVTPDWLQSGQGQRQRHPSPDGYGYSAAAALAHLASEPAQSYGLPELTWESVVNSFPIGMFVLPLRDEALAPRWPQGLAVVWNTQRRLLPGRLILLRDQHNWIHARLVIAQKAPGQWIAASTNPAFPNFDPSLDKFTVLAIHRGVLDAADLDE